MTRPSGGGNVTGGGNAKGRAGIPARPFVGSAWLAGAPLTLGAQSPFATEHAPAAPLLHPAARQVGSDVAQGGSAAVRRHQQQPQAQSTT